LTLIVTIEATDSYILKTMTEDLFVHVTAFREGGIFSEPDERYGFDIGERNGKPIAKNIRLVDDDSN
jgi:cold shock CspA family protein